MTSSARSTINRAPSAVRMKLVPIISVIIASILTALPIVADYPILPPFGLMVLLAWRLLQPGFWTIWAGFPLGLVDDIFSGQPFGSAAFFWSIIFITLEMLDRKTFNRDYILDWVLASLFITFALVGGMLVLDFPGNFFRLPALLPQVILSILIYPLFARFVAKLDKWRLAR